MSFDNVPGCHKVAVRSDDRNHASSTKDEISSSSLLDGIQRFGSDLGRVLVDERILSHASTRHTLEKQSCFGQRWEGFTIMPVNDLKRKLSCQLEVNLLAVQVKHVAPEILSRFDRFPVEEQTEYFVFLPTQ